MYSGSIELNGKGYFGQIRKRRLAEWPEAAPESTEQQRQTRRFLRSWSLQTVVGLQVDRDYDGDLSMCRDSTCETRFRGQVTLPALWQSEATWQLQGDPVGCCSSDGAIWLLEAAASGSDRYVRARYYVAAAEPVSYTHLTLPTN